MRERLKFKSIYTKFTLIFLLLWWFLNSLTFGIIAHTMSRSVFVDSTVMRPELFEAFRELRTVTGLAFTISILMGSTIIFFVVRSVVKPIKKLSTASKEIAKGNFDIQVKVISSDEIGQLTKDFNRMAKELNNIEVMRKDFVSNVSHEFKTPITSIKGFARLIKDGKLSEEQFEEYTDIIINESERLSELSSNLLKLSELDTKMIPKHFTTFSLDEQIRKTILMLETQWVKKRLEFEIDLEPVQYTGDEYLIFEIWLNLIQNAIKFSDEQTVISIGLHNTGQILRFEVTNTGPYIDAHDQGRIFERFYKGDKAHSKEGNGLGLAIVKTILETVDGRIFLESHEDRHTTFTVEFKRAPDSE